MLPEPEGAPEVHRTGHAFTDRIVAGSAILISLCSLGLAIHHGHTMERLVEANSRPFLEFESSNADVRADGTFLPELTLRLANPGAGAARIGRFAIALDGRPVAGWPELVKALAADAAAHGVAVDAAAPKGQFTYSTVTHSYLKAGSEQVILRWPRTEANAAFWAYADEARQHDRISLEACYCSIFDECWLASSRVFRPQPVAACPD